MNNIATKNIVDDSFGGRMFAGVSRWVTGGGITGLWNRAREFVTRKRASAGGACPIRCFVAGTLVWSASGLQAIENITAGEDVVTLNETTGERELGTVVETVTVAKAPELHVYIDINNESNKGVTSTRTELIRTTDDHPFLTTCKGWVPAELLTPGDNVVLATGGEGTVSRVVFTSIVSRVYNLSVAGNHNFFVGRDAVVVHNAGLCRLVGHHWVPQQRLIRDWAARAGLNVDDFVQNIPEDMHRWMHGNHRRTQDFNFKWQDFRLNNLQATKEQILAFRDQLMAHYQSEWSRLVQP